MNGTTSKAAVNTDLSRRLALAELRIAELEQQRDQLQIDRDVALRENEMLRRELLTPEVFSRLVEWLRDPNPKNASGAFTAGIERQIAYALEMDVLPEVKSLRIRLANAAKGIAPQPSIQDA